MTSQRTQVCAITPNDAPRTLWNSEVNWMLLKDAFVEIRRSDGTTIDRGRVDAVTIDGSVLWLAFEGVLPRRLHERLPSIEVWILH